LPGCGHLAKFWHENDMFGSAWNSFSGVGTLRISGTDPICATALRGDGSQYSSLPADEEVMKWSGNYISGSGTRQTITWAWKFVDGYSFIGEEQNSFNTSTIRIRGIVEWDLDTFHVEWNYNSSDGTKGMVLFQGTVSADQRTLTGKRTVVRMDGTVTQNYDFTATRTN